MVEGRNIFVEGRTQSGKTYLVRQAIAASWRYLVYLTKMEDHSFPGVYFDGAQAQDRQLMLRWWKYCVEHGGRFRIVYRPADPFSLAEFDEIAGLAYKCQCMELVAEEAMGYLCGYDPKHAEGHNVTRLITAGSTRGVNTWIITQRPTQIPHILTSQARLAYLFATHEPADLIYLRQAFGSLAAANVEKLVDHNHVRWTEAGEVTVGKA